MEYFIRILTEGTGGCIRSGTKLRKVNRGTGHHHMQVIPESDILHIAVGDGLRVCVHIPNVAHQFTVALSTCNACADAIKKVNEFFIYYTKCSQIFPIVHNTRTKVRFVFG